MQRRTSLRSYTGPVCLAGAFLAAMALSSSAKAALTLTLSETGFGPVTQTDVGNTGTVQFTGAYGDFTTNIVIGSSNKLDAIPGPSAQLQIQTLTITNNNLSGGTKTLTVALSDDGYTFPGTNGSTDTLGSTLGGTLTKAAAGDAVTFQSFSTPTNATPGPQTFTSTGTDGSFSVPTASTTFLQGASYSLNNVTTISLSNAGESANISGSTVVTVPEPVSAGLALLLTAGALGRRSRRTA